MVYGFARQSEGHLDISSTVGRGTIVTLLLPRYIGNAIVPTDTLASAEPRRLACATVLVVEDESLVRELIVEALRELGCIVMQAADGHVGRRQLASGSHIDLLITDIGLPGVDGRQLASEAMQDHPHIKVLYITGYAHEPSFASDLAVGERELITKPFLIDALKTRVVRLLEAG
jgi:CheY-like chemotaxis protein